MRDPLLVRTEKAAAREVSDTEHERDSGSEKKEVADKAVNGSPDHGDTSRLTDTVTTGVTP